MITQLSRKKPVAIKQHTCDWCCGKIVKGTRYEYSTYVYDATPYAWKNHLKCAAIAEKLNMFRDSDEGVSTEIFIEYVREFYERNRNKDEPKLHYSKVEEMVDYLIGFYDLQIRRTVKELKRGF